jgi:hypothetical protein
MYDRQGWQNVCLLLHAHVSLEKYGSIETSLYLPGAVAEN